MTALNENPPAVEMPGGSYGRNHRPRLHTQTSRKPQARARARSGTTGFTRHLSQTLRNPSCGRKPGRGELRRNGRPGAAHRQVLTAATSRRQDTALRKGGVCLGHAQSSGRSDTIERSGTINLIVLFSGQKEGTDDHSS